jgi:hypothetical protein
MALAFAIGGQTNQGIDCRENRLLPTEPRDLAVVRWLNVTLVPMAILFAAKGLGMAWALVTGGKAIMPPETLAISTVYDFTYAGTMYVLLPRLGLLGGLLAKPLEPFLKTRRRREIAARPLIAFFLVFAGLFLVFTWGLPFLLARSLPAHVGEFTTTSALVLLFGFAASLSGLWWTPRTTSWLDTPMPSVATTRSSPGHQRLSDRLTGVYRVVWTHVIGTLVVTAVGLAVFLAARPFLPPRAGSDPRFFSIFFLVPAFLFILSANTWAPWARHLKVLPLSVRQVNALFLCTPILTWMAVWSVMLLGHVVMSYRISEELGPLAILAYAGITAATHALALWSHGNRFGRVAASWAGAAAAGGAAMYLFASPDFSTRALLLTVGVFAFAFAAFMNHRTLTRSTSSALAYRPRLAGQAT